MTEIVPTPPSQPDLASQVVAISGRVRQMKDICQLNGHFEFDPEQFQEARGPLKVSQIPPQTQGMKVGETAIIAQVAFALRAQHPAEAEASKTAEKPAVQIAGVFAICYEIAEGPALTEEAVSAFVQVNGPFNLTAFWREYVISSCSRAGLAPIPIVPFNAAAALNALKHRTEPAPANG